MSWNQLRDMLRENRLYNQQPQQDPNTGVDGRGRTTCPICGLQLTEGSTDSSGVGSPAGYIGNANRRDCPMGHYTYP